MLHTAFIIIFVQYKLYHGVRSGRVVGFSRNSKNLTAIEFTTTTTMTNRSDTLSWCQISGKNSRNRRENLTEIELTQHFKRLFKRTLNIQTSSETIRYDHSILET